MQLVDYAGPLGLPALRQLLQRRSATLGIDAPMEQILLTESGTHAVDLLCRFLLKPGDCVLVDDPSYFNYHALLKAHQVQAIGVPYTHSGPDLEAFAQALQAHSPRLYITNSGLHNPTGAVLSANTAHRLLGLAERSELIIVEDDIFADFELQPAPRLAALDGLSRVIHVGSFSKTLSAASRCGYRCAPRLDRSTTDLKLATSFGGGHLAAQLMHIALTDSGYRRHMQSIRSRLADAAHTAETAGAGHHAVAAAGSRPVPVVPAARRPRRRRTGAAMPARGHRAGAGQRVQPVAARGRLSALQRLAVPGPEDLAGAGAGVALSWMQAGPRRQERPAAKALACHGTVVCPCCRNARMSSFSDPQAVARYAEGPLRQVPGFLALQQMSRLLLAEHVPAQGRVLVLGAGGGLELKAFAEAQPGWQLLGVDPAAPMLALAEQTLGPLMSRVQLLEGYIDDAPTCASMVPAAC